MGQSKDTKEVVEKVPLTPSEEVIEKKTKEVLPEAEKPQEQEAKTGEAKVAVKIKKKRKRGRSSPYNVFKKKMMNSEEIKSIPSKKRFKWVAEQWKKQKAESK